jgi:uncharacterized protein
MEQQEGNDLLLVEGYGDYGFRFFGKRVEGSVLVTETGYYPIEVETLADLALTHFDAVSGENRPEILLIGTGEKMTLLPAVLRKELEAQGLGFELMDTGAAARTFNVLRMEDRRVAAILIQTP